MPSAPVGVALPDVKSHMLWAVLSTMLCCMPTGIVAIIYASQVMSCMNSGDGEGALRASQRAFWWSLGGPIAWLVIGVVVGIVELGLMMVS
jgi:hypothetical protein